MDFSDVYKHHHHLVTFSPDQRYLTAVVGHKLILRDAETLHMLHVIHLSTPTTTPTPPSTSTTVLSWVSFSPDSLYVLCASYDEGWIQVWTLDGHEPVASIHEGLAGCVKVMWHPRHRSVLSWSHAHLRISIWNLMESQLHYLPRPKHVHEGFSFRNDGMYFALLSREDCKDCVCIYETVDWGLVNKFFVETLDARDLAWSPDGSFLAIWDTILEYKVLVYTPDGRLLQMYTAYEHGLGIKQVQWSPTSQFLAVGSYDQTVHLLNHYTFQPIVIWKGAHPSSSTYTLFRQSVAKWTTHGSKNTSSAWPVIQHVTSKPKLQYERVKSPTNVTFPSIKVDPDKPLPNMGIGILAWSPDGLYLAVKNETIPTVVSIYSMLSIQLKVLIQATEHVKHMAWHPTRKHVLVFCTGTETLHFWQGTQAPPPSNPPKGMNTTTTHTDPHLYSGKSAPSSYVPSQPMDNEPMDEIDEPHDGMAMCVNVPATDFHINTFRWSQDGKKMILLDKSRFCIAFEVEEML